MTTQKDKKVILNESNFVVSNRKSTLMRRIFQASREKNELESPISLDSKQGKKKEHYQLYKILNLRR